MTEAEDEQLVEAVRGATGERLRRTGRAREGTLGGAVLLERADGSGAVLTHFLGTVAHARQTAEALTVAARRGLPVPQPWRPVVLGPRAVVVLQSRLAGAPPSALTPAVVDTLVALNERCAGLARSTAVPRLPLSLTASGDPVPRHEVLAEHSPRSRRVLDAIRAIGRAEGSELGGDDLLHVDLDVANVLVDEAGDVSGLVDWNLGAYRGDRLLALVKTRFEQEWALREPDPAPELLAAVRHLDDVLRSRVPAADLRRYWAHRMLYQLHWVLQMGRADVVDWHLDVAEERLL